MQLPKELCVGLGVMGCIQYSNDSYDSESRYKMTSEEAQDEKQKRLEQDENKVK